MFQHFKPHSALVVLMKNGLIAKDLHQSKRPVFLLISKYYHCDLQNAQNQNSKILNRKHFLEFQKNLNRQQHFQSNRNKVTLSAPVALDTTTIPNTTATKVSKKQKKKSDLPSNIRYFVNPYAKSETETSAVDGTSPRPLLLMFGWMLAKEVHMDKYREFWFQRGYDVLSVRTSPFDLLLPLIGGRRNGETMYKFIANKEPFYDEILIHAFSVGGYQLGEFFDSVKIRKDHDSKAKRIYDSLKGIVLDSCVFAEDAGPGLSRAITTHRLWQPLLEKSIVIWLKLTNPFTFSRYMHVQRQLFENDRKMPGIIFYSKRDVVSSEKSNETLFKGWKVLNDICEIHCWNDALHVLIYKDHKTEYEQMVDDFVAKIGITKAKKQIAN